MLNSHLQLFTAEQGIRNSSLAPTNNYEVWIAQMGERTVNGQNLPDAEKVIVTKQYIGGSLFKSQNGTIWTQVSLKI